MSRMRPTSVAAPTTSLMSARDLGDGLAELHLVAATQAFRVPDGSTVQERAVTRPEVFDVHVAVATEQARVHLRHEVVVEHDPATSASPDRELVVQGESLAATCGRFDDAEPRRPAAARRLLDGRSGC